MLSALQLYPSLLAQLRQTIAPGFPVEVVLSVLIGITSMVAFLKLAPQKEPAFLRDFIREGLKASAEAAGEYGGEEHGTTTITDEQVDSLIRGQHQSGRTAERPAEERKNAAESNPNEAESDEDGTAAPAETPAESAVVANSVGAGGSDAELVSTTGSERGEDEDGEDREDQSIPVPDPAAVAALYEKLDEIQAGSLSKDTLTDEDNALLKKEIRRLELEKQDMTKKHKQAREDQFARMKENMSPEDYAEFKKFAESRLYQDNEARREQDRVFLSAVVFFVFCAFMATLVLVFFLWKWWGGDDQLVKSFVAEVQRFSLSTKTAVVDDWLLKDVITPGFQESVWATVGGWKKEWDMFIQKVEDVQKQVPVPLPGEKLYRPGKTEL